MKTLVLKLKGPLQSWGSDSRYRVRTTNSMPTKSGVLGLLAAAQGRSRVDEIVDLVGLSFAVRIDQPGTLERDYQTAKASDSDNAKLSTRYYLADAVFIAAVTGSDSLVDSLASAIQNPVYPLYLGRRNCPVNSDLLMMVTEKDGETILREIPWQAASWHKKHRDKTVALPIIRDAKPGEDGDLLQDVPISFSQEHRQYTWRTVVEVQPARFDNPEGLENSDPFLEAVRSS